jgi:hypothetical protein
VSFVEPDVAVYCVLLIAGQLSARTPLVGTAVFDDADVGEGVPEDGGSEEAVVFEGVVDCGAESLFPPLFLFARDPPTAPPTTAATTITITAASTIKACFLRRPHQRSGSVVVVWCTSPNFSPCPCSGRVSGYEEVEFGTWAYLELPALIL